MAVALSKIATKLAAWLGIYQISAVEANNRLTYQNYEVGAQQAGGFATSLGNKGRKALTKKGAFKGALQELVAQSLPNLTAPGSFAGTVTTGQIALSWAAVSHATSYRLERSTSSNFLNNFIVLYKGSTRSFTDTHVTAGTVYYYRVTGTTGEPLVPQTYQETYSTINRTAS